MRGAGQHGGNSLLGIASYERRQYRMKYETVWLILGLSRESFPRQRGTFSPRSPLTVSHSASHLFWLFKVSGACKVNLFHCDVK